MSAEWREETLGSIAAEEPYSTQIGPFGSKVKAASYVDMGIPYLRGANVNRGRFHDGDFVYLSEDFVENELEKFLCRPDDIVFVHRGTIGKIGLIPEGGRHNRYVLGNSMLKLTCNRRLADPRFVFYWLCSPAGQNYIFSNVSHTGVPAIASPLKTLRDAPVSLPCLAEQERIAGILGALDDKIELNRDMNRTLEATAQAIFRSWFVDFDPVVAKADGRRPFGLRDDLAAVFPDRFVDSELGPIPQGWKVTSLGQSGKWLSGGTPSKKIEGFWSGDIPWISAKSIRSLIRESSSHLTQEGLENGSRLAAPHSVLFVVRGMSLASEFRVGMAMRAVAFNQDMKAIIPDGRVSSLIVLLLLRDRTPSILDLVDEASHGTRRLQTSLLNSIAFAIPEPEAQELLCSGLWPLVEKADANNEETVTLAGLRDILLPRLLSGEIRVGQAEKAVEEVL